VLEDGALTEGAAGVVRAGVLGATFRGVLGVLTRGDTEGLGATVTLGLLRLGVETTGGRADLALKLLLVPRL
jgi:hypothetical protein